MFQLQLIILFVFTTCLDYHVAAPPPLLLPDSFGIYGGHPIAIEKAPFVALFVPKYYRIHCGASIITERFLVTAGQCIEYFDEYEVFVGTDKVKRGGTKHEVEKLIRHPEFNWKTLDFDIAVIKLKDKLEFNDKVKPIEMVDTDVIEAGEFMTTMGFGKRPHILHNSVSKVLLSVDLPYVDYQQCKEKFEDFYTITDNMFCAGGEYMKGPCDFDVGGPMTFKGKLAGIVSYYIECGLEGYPYIFSNVSTLRQWVNETIKENS